MTSDRSSRYPGDVTLHLTAVDGETCGSSTGKAKAGVFGTSMNLVVQIMGLGVLQLSYMLRQGGWSCMGLMICCAIAANYTGKLLIQCCYNRDGLRIYQTYGEIGEAAFGNTGRLATRVFENLTFFGICALFLILAAGFLEDIPVGITTQLWTLFGGLVVSIPVLILPAIAELQVVSFVGVVAVIVVVVAVIVEAGSVCHRSVAKTDVILPLGFSTAFSSMTLAFGCHAGLPEVEKSMREGKKFPLMFNIAFSLVIILYLPTAAIGYAIFGDEVQSPILKSLPSDSMVQVIAKVLMTVHILLAYPVLMMLFVLPLENALDVKPGTRAYLAKRCTVRFMCIAANVSVAVFVPYFPDMMGLVGALGSVMTTFVLPAIFYLKLCTCTISQRILPFVVGLVGAAGGFAGAFQALVDLIKKVNS